MRLRTVVLTAAVAAGAISLSVPDARAQQTRGAGAAVRAPQATDRRLIDAVKAGDKTGVSSLLGQRAIVNAAEADGTTALHWAVRGDDLETVDRLIRAGADVKAANRYGVTPLYLASVNGSAAVIERLLRAG